MYYLIKKYLQHETILLQNVLLKQKVVLISREVIERARQRDEQTDVLTEVRTRFQGPQYVLPLTMALLTSYTVNARYAEPAFGRLTTRATNTTTTNTTTSTNVFTLSGVSAVHSFTYQCTQGSRVLRLKINHLGSQGHIKNLTGRYHAPVIDRNCLTIVHSPLM